jgi:hypothetical protein
VLSVTASTQGKPCPGERWDQQYAQTVAETSYASCGDLSLAYQVFGDGPIPCLTCCDAQRPGWFEVYFMVSPVCSRRNTLCCNGFGATTGEDGKVSNPRFRHLQEWRGSPISGQLVAERAETLGVGSGQPAFSAGRSRSCRDGTTLNRETSPANAMGAAVAESQQRVRLPRRPSTTGPRRLSAPR